MFFNVREQSEQLLVLHFLNNRMLLPEKDKQSLFSLVKGLDGEVYFDSMVNRLVKVETYVLRNLELSVGNRPLQIDTLMITSDAIYLYEVKNFEGSYIRTDEHFKTFSGAEFLIPSNQLTRTKTHVLNLLRKWKVSLPLKGFVVFVNPMFTLYESKTEDPFIFYGQIESHFRKVNQTRGSLKKHHQSVLDKFLYENKKESLYKRNPPDYSFENLKKGLCCHECGSFDLKNESKTSTCLSCGNKILFTRLILKHIDEYHTLFLNEKITRNTIFEWCGGVVSKRRLMNVLNKYYTRHGHSHSSYYSNN